MFYDLDSTFSLYITYIKKNVILCIVTQIRNLVTDRDLHPVMRKTNYFPLIVKKLYMKFQLLIKI